MSECKKLVAFTHEKGKNLNQKQTYMYKQEVTDAHLNSWFYRIIMTSDRAIMGFDF